jgi:excisionase family DNA binding protein
MAGQNSAQAQSVTTNRPPGRTLAPKWDDRDAFSVEEVGEILGISRGSSCAAVKVGDLPVIRIGRRCIVPRAALERLLGATG